MKNTWLVGSIYTLATIGTCIAGMSGNHQLDYLCKPALMVVLSIWFYLRSRAVGDRFTLLVQAGLFFSLIGDVAMMFVHKDEFNFLVGLAAFMLAQLCYAVAFADNVFNVGAMEGFILPGICTVIIVVYTTLFVWDILPHVDNGLTYPVTIYAIAIATMAIAASFRYMRTYPRSFWTVFIGSMLFVASDSALAVNRFRKPFELAPLVIMITYSAAQFLIAWGCLAHVLDPDNLRRRAALTT
jgi:uncharacterized membrane protein YhhN